MFSCNDTLWAVHSCTALLLSLSLSLSRGFNLYSLSMSNCNWMSRQRRVGSQFPTSEPAFSWSLSNLHFICFFLSLHSPPSFSLSLHLSLLLLPLTLPILVDPGKVGSCCQLSEVHLSWREAQWPGQCWKGYLPSHLLWDAGELVFGDFFKVKQKPFIIQVSSFPVSIHQNWIIYILWLFPSNLTKATLTTVGLPYKGYPIMFHVW